MRYPSIRTLLLIILVLNALDAAFTYQAVVLDKTSIEVNPFMNRLISFSPELFIIFKVGMLGVLALWLYQKMPPKLPFIFTVVSKALLSLLILVLAYLVFYGFQVAVLTRFGINPIGLY